LNDCDITDKDFEHALKVWKHFKMTTFREYHDLYLKTDVILLADAFENFRDVCMKNYELDATMVFHRAWVGLGCLSEKDRGPT